MNEGRMKEGTMNDEWWMMNQVSYITTKTSTHPPLRPHRPLHLPFNASSCGRYALMTPFNLLLSLTSDSIVSLKISSSAFFFTLVFLARTLLRSLVHVYITGVSLCGWVWYKHEVIVMIMVMVMTRGWPSQHTSYLQPITVVYLLLF